MQKKFLHIFYLYFNLDSTQFTTILDNNKDSNYIMEITGGTPNVFNVYLHNLCKEDVRFGFKPLYDMFGVDNQNQFCYMWAILYLWVNIFNPGNFPFSFIHKQICDHQIIPVQFIKSFVYWLIYFFRQEKSVLTEQMEDILSDTYFNRHFYQITSNGTTYGKNGTFNCYNTTYTLYNLIIPGRTPPYKMSPIDVVFNCFDTTLDFECVVLWKDI